MRQLAGKRVIFSQCPPRTRRGRSITSRNRTGAGGSNSFIDRTAVDYDRIERFIALGSGSWYRRRALARAGLALGMTVLDIGVGTGLTARQATRLAGEGGHVTGVDPGAGMLERAQVPERVGLVIGSAEAIPAAWTSADFLSMGYAVRHIGDLSAACKEFLRVLMPGGRLCWLAITPPPVRLHARVVPFIARYGRRS